MNWIKQKKDLSKLNLILSLIGVMLILIPFIMIGFIDFFSNSEPDMMFLIGTILITCSIPMIIVVFMLYTAVIISSVFMLRQKIKPASNTIALVISIVGVIVCIVGTYWYIVTGIGLVDTISRLG